MTRLRGADRLIVALDATDVHSAMRTAKQLRGLIRIVKVGSALFTACGPDVMRRLRSLGFRIMLDLKFLDIPSTVELSCRAAVHHRASLMTVHACGEPAMLKAAVRGARDEARLAGVPRPVVLGVTVLTSVKDARATRVGPRVMALAASALDAGCDGVVASAHEVAALRQRFGPRARIACPGIRLAHDRADDQQRVTTPHDALARGADWVVVGRPITAAHDPRAAARRFLQDIEEDAC